MTDAKTLRVVSWNVNGLRAAGRKGFLDWLAGDSGDIIGLQETKAMRDQLDDSLAEPEGWHTYFHSAQRKGYSGVAMYSRIEPDVVATTMGAATFDDEGRAQFMTLGELTVVNVYFPNGSGKNRDLSRIPYKLAFYERLFEMLTPRLDAGERILVMGDFNTAHRDIDLARPKQNVKTSGFRPEERAEFQTWIDAGWTDTFRHVQGDVTERYSWWSNRKGVRERNVGWRIDYVLATPAALDFVTDAEIHQSTMGSDHCPVSVTIGAGVLS